MGWIDGKMRGRVSGRRAGEDEGKEGDGVTVRENEGRDEGWEVRLRSSGW